MNKKLQRVVLAAATALLATTLAQAQIVTEDFAYPSGALNTQSGGTGWASAWNNNGSTHTLVTNAPLAYASGNYNITQASGAGVFFCNLGSQGNPGSYRGNMRTNSGATGSVVWFSCLMMAPVSTAEVFIGFNSGTPAATYSPSTTYSIGLSNTTLFVSYGGSLAIDGAPVSTTLALNTVHLVLGCITFQASGLLDQLQVWADPPDLTHLGSPQFQETAYDIGANLSNIEVGGLANSGLVSTPTGSCAYVGALRFSDGNGSGASQAYTDVTGAVNSVTPQAPVATLPASSPNQSLIYLGTPVTLLETAGGTAPLSYQWLADNGTGTLADVGGLTTSSTLAVNTTGFAAGPYKYEVIVSNSLGVSTSAVLTLTFAVQPQSGTSGGQPGQLNPANWRIYNFSGALSTNLTGGSPVPPTGLHVVSTGGSNSVEQTNGQSAALPAINQVTTLTDNNPATYVTLTNPTALLIDMGQTNVVDRVYVIGSQKPANYWPNDATATNAPLGLIVVYVGNTPNNATQVATWTVPYDAGNPVETEADIRFSPAAGRYVRLELHTSVTWGVNYWPGISTNQPTETAVNWNVGELEVYGFTGVAATQTNVNAVVIPTASMYYGSSQNYQLTPLGQAAMDLSYYLGVLSGQPYPIIPPSSTGQYSGMLYTISDLASQAPNYNTMMANIASGNLPTNVNVTISGNVVTFKSWPYRAVLWSAWEFLERQGVRWVYPDAHGDYVPVGAGINTNILPLQYTPSAVSIDAVTDFSQSEPWPWRDLQSVRQEYLYPWRNRWNCSYSVGRGPLGGSEIPLLASPGGSINSLYSEGFYDFPHNFTTVVPTRILAMTAYTNWWGWANSSSSSAVNDANENDPVFIMDKPSLISWVASKITNWAAVQPLPCSYPLNIVDRGFAYNLLPMDMSLYSQDPVTLASNGPAVAEPVPWITEYSYSYSGAYYSFVTAVANQAQQWGFNGLVGALAYADVFTPPTNLAPLAVFPTNVWVEVCVYGSPNLPMSAGRNAGLKGAFDAWNGCCSHLAHYDYTLLLTDTPQQSPLLPVPAVAGIVGKAQYFASIGALNGECQLNLTNILYNPWDFYAYPRIRWNTNQTASQLETEFFNGYFREAAAPMLAYYQAMENNQVSNNVSMYYMGCADNIMPGAFPLSVLAEMKTNLNAAVAAATNWWVVSRVSNMVAGFDWILTNCPDYFASGVNFTNTSLYPALNPTTNLTQVSLAGWYSLSGGTWRTWYGGYGAFIGSGTNTTWYCGAQAWLQHTYNIPAGTYLVNVTAKGTESGNVWPVMNFYFGPDYGGSVSVNTTTDSTYSFTVTIPSSGAWDMVITYNNSGTSGARNLYVDGIQISQL